MASSDGGSVNAEVIFGKVASVIREIFSAQRAKAVDIKPATFLTKLNLSDYQSLQLIKASRIKTGFKKAVRLNENISFELEEDLYGFAFSNEDETQVLSTEKSIDEIIKDSWNDISAAEIDFKEYERLKTQSEDISLAFDERIAILRQAEKAVLSAKKPAVKVLNLLEQIKKQPSSVSNETALIQLKSSAQKVRHESILAELNIARKISISMVTAYRAK